VTDRFSLAGRVALVTGASRGLGYAIAAAYADAGADLALVARDAERLERAATEIRSRGRRVETALADVSDAQQVEAVVNAFTDRFGGIDLLVNAAGISPIYKRAEEITTPDWDRIIATNLGGTFHCCQSVGRRMLARGAGVITNVTSVGAVVALPRLAAYCAAKAGVQALTKTLAIEWASRGVRVNAIGPSFMETDMTRGLKEHERFGPAITGATPLGRFGDPDDVVGAAIFLASDAARFVTGETIFVDGGWLAQ